MVLLGRQFEEAVYAFAQALDPAAEVLFNHKVPDRDTGKLRQCDVWINAKFGGHWPLSILVSCKDRKRSGRKLHSGDIGSFCDEVRSTGASTGVIYCNVEFTGPAIRKAKANAIACCRLYQNEPADIPEAIWFEQFSCTSAVKLALKTDVSPSRFETWNDIFNIEFDSDDGHMTILDAIVAGFTDGEKQAVLKANKTGWFPPHWRTDLTFGIDEMDDDLRIQVFGLWRRYCARVEATLLDGSYCLSDESFKGSQIGPAIDVRGTHLGNHWVEITDDDFVPPSNRIVVILMKGNVRKALREGYGSEVLRPRD